MNDLLNLNRFMEAQLRDYDAALNEIKSGHKTGCWMWYIFPQYKGLGQSVISQKYAIANLDEALQYFKHPVLGQRLLEITTTFLSWHNKSAYEILGDPDYLKMKSSMTLFDIVQRESDVFSKVLETFYSGIKCDLTISLIE